MGSCYSRQASKQPRSDYSTVPMDSNAMEVRQARPTPYSRSQGSGIPCGFKRRIPIPISAKGTSLKQDDGPDSSTIARDFKSMAIGDDGSITELKGTQDVKEIKCEMETRLDTDPNSNIVESNHDKQDHVVNNNNPDVDSNITSELKEKTEPCSTVMTNISIIPKYIPVIKRASEESSMEMADGGYKSGFSSKIPAGKFTTQLGSLPRPQVPQLNDNRAMQQLNGQQRMTFSSLESGNTSSRLKEYEKSLAKCRVPVAKSRIGISDSSESINNEIDSGIGNSLSEKSQGNTGEDSATLKDFEHTPLSNEGSPNFLFSSSAHAINDCEKNKTPEGSSKRDDLQQQGEKKYRIPVLVQRPKVCPDTYSTPKTYLPRRISDLNSYYSSSSWHERRRFFSDLTKSSFSPSTSKNLTSFYNKYMGRQNYSHSSPRLYSQGNSYIPINLSRSIPSISSNRGRLSSSTEIGKSGIPRCCDPVLSSDNGFPSPPSEIEHREFLIDDEISDQPSLITFENVEIPDETLNSLQQSLNELHALQTVKCNLGVDFNLSAYERDRTESLSRISSSSTSSLGSDDMMLDYDKSSSRRPSEADSLFLESRDWQQKKSMADEDSSCPSSERKTFSSLTLQEKRVRSLSTPLRPPRQMVVTDGGDGCIRLDASSYRLLLQDLNGAKTLLLRLKRVLEEAETLNPFEGSRTMAACYNFLALNDIPKGSVLSSKLENSSLSDGQPLTQENADLRRQVVYLQQQLKERDNTIKVVQQQLSTYMHVAKPDDTQKTNAATQTENKQVVSSLSNCRKHSSTDDEDPAETIVSFKDPGFLEIPGLHS